MFEKRVSFMGINKLKCVPLQVIFSIALGPFFCNYLDHNSIPFRGLAGEISSSHTHTITITFLGTSLKVK